MRRYTLRVKTYYLSTTGSDSNLGTSPAQAWQTMAKVNALTAKPNEAVHILLKDGDVFSSGTGFVTPFNGSPTRYNMLGRYGAGPNPIVNHTGGASGYAITVNKNYWVINGVDSSTGGRNISISDAHHIHISNADYIATSNNESSINIDGADNASHDIWMEDLNIHDTPGWGVTAGTNQIYNVTIKHCDFDGIGNTDSPAHHSIYFHNVRNLLIDDCNISNSYIHGIKLWQSGGKTTSGRIRRCTISTSARSTTAGLDISFDGVTGGVIIENCLLKDNLYDLSINWENNIANNIEIYNCTIIRHYIGIGIGSGATGWIVKNNNVIQDTAWINNANRYCLNWDGAVDAVNNTFQDNNWYFKDGGGSLNPIRDSGGLMSFATWQGKTGSPDSTGSSVDPTFVTAYTDMHLQAGSSIRNSGTNIGEHSRSDRDGLALDATPHVGCYQQ